MLHSNAGLHESKRSHLIKKMSSVTNPLKVQSVSTRCRSHIVSIIPADVPATKALGHLQV